MTTLVIRHEDEDVGKGINSGIGVPARRDGSCCPNQGEDQERPTCGTVSHERRSAGMASLVDPGTGASTSRTVRAAAEVVNSVD